jgi:lipopolysaccharide export system permease protein
MLRNHQTGDMRITAFNDYQLLIDPSLKILATDMQSRMVSTLGLIKAPTPVHFGELSWRLGLPLAAFNLIIVGLAVASVNPRVGKSYHLAVALFCFVGYYNMINVGQNWIASERISLFEFMVGLHGGAFCMALAWLLFRHFNASWKNILVTSKIYKTGGGT